MAPCQTECGEDGQQRQAHSRSSTATVPGRESCTFRRFRIRGFTEGMLRTVKGNICRGGGESISTVGRGGQRSPGGRRKNRTRKQREEGGGQKEETSKCEWNKRQGTGERWRDREKVKERTDEKSYQNSKLWAWTGKGGRLIGLMPRFYFWKQLLLLFSRAEVASNCATVVALCRRQEQSQVPRMQAAAVEASCGVHTYCGRVSGAGLDNAPPLLERPVWSGDIEKKV